MTTGSKFQWRNVISTTIGVLVLLALTGALYQAVETNAEAHRFPEPGRLVGIGGVRLKLYCSGRGSPTVILEAGLGDVLTEWNRV